MTRDVPAVFTYHSRPFEYFCHGVAFMLNLSKFTVTTLLVCVVLTVSCSGKDNGNNTKTPKPPTMELAIRTDKVFDLAAEKLTKTVESIQDSNRFPRYIEEDGTWATTDSHAWSSGFFAGCLWIMFEYTGDEIWKKHAVKWTESMEREKHNRDNHNNGFMMMPGFGNGYRLTGNEHYREVLIESARSLASRYSDKVGCIKANEMKQWKYPVMVDTMVNIELLFWAAKNGGDPSWHDMAVAHATNTMRYHVREDGSTVQIVDCDPETGDVLGHYTLCGLSGDSAWSRGQGQALYGFAVAYRETGNPEFLETAQRLADYFIEKLADDPVPDWDNKVPNFPDTIRDSSAGSIASVGLFELQKLVKDQGNAQRYRMAATDIFVTLVINNYLTIASNSYGLIKHATWKKPTDPQADTSLIWGDYNFLEALVLYDKIYKCK